MATETIIVKRDLRAEQRAAAAAFRESMTKQGTLVVRLLSSPGSGKTTLLVETARVFSPRFSIGVLVGDIETQRDAQRISPYAPAVQITTGGACHLEYPLIDKSLPQLGIDGLDFLFIEDVGNLICPASHDLGEHLRVILLSTTEGDDKPGKYPKAFRTGQVVVITKMDLLPHVPFSVDRATEDAWQVQPELQILQVAATTGQGMAEWCNMLEQKRSELGR